MHNKDKERLRNLPPGYKFFVPEYIPKGIWLEVFKCNAMPLSPHVTREVEKRVFSDEVTKQKELRKASSVIYMEIAAAQFNIDVKVGEASHNLPVVRWQFPLTHGMCRTAYLT